MLSTHKLIEIWRLISKKHNCKANAPVSEHSRVFSLGRWGAQWLSGRVLDSRPKCRRFEPHRRHCVVSLSKIHLS